MAEHLHLDPESMFDLGTLDDLAALLDEINVDDASAPSPERAETPQKFAVDPSEATRDLLARVPWTNRHERLEPAVPEAEVLESALAPSESAASKPSPIYGPDVQTSHLFELVNWRNEASPVADLITSEDSQDVVDASVDGILGNFAW